MTPPEPPQLIAFGFNHHTAPLGLREAWALSDAQRADFHQELRALQGIQECMVLPTCNRLECYLNVTSVYDPSALERLYAKMTGASLVLIRDNCFQLEGLSVWQHLTEVCCGLNAQLIGETEVLGQVKQAYQRSVDEGSAGRVLHRVLQKSFQVAKHVRSHTGIGQGQVSLGNVAVDLATRIFGDLSECTVLVVGCGQVGADTARAFHSRGAGKLRITSRTPKNACQIATDIGGDSIPFEGWVAEVPQVDIVVCSTASPEVLLSFESMERAMEQRPDRPLFLIDLAVPRDIEATVADLENVFLYNLEDLSAITNANMRNREREVEHCRDLIAEKLAHHWNQLNEDLNSNGYGPI
jgi:glutamyl-tRNA reductase